MRNRWSGISHPADIRVPLRLPNAGWAWECLRRNPGYARDFRRNRPGQPRPIKLKSSTTLLRQRRRFLDAEKWGLLNFADPKVSAAQADVFWTRDALPGGVDVSLRRVGNAEIADLARSDIILLHRIDCRRSILETPSGAQHILLDGTRFWVQLNAAESSMIGDHAALAIHIDGAAHARKKLKTGAELLELYRLDDPRRTAVAARRYAKKIHKALIAYDIRAAGGSYKDIAVALVGEKRVKEDWVGGKRHLKDRAKRALAPAQELIDGGYRRLLVG